MSNEIKNKKLKELKFFKYKNRTKYNIEVKKSHIKIIFFLLNFSIIVPIKMETIIVGKLTAAKKIPVVFKFLVVFNMYNGKTIKYIVLPNKDTALPNNNSLILLSLLCTLTLHTYFILFYKIFQFQYIFSLQHKHLQSLFFLFHLKVVLIFLLFHYFQ